MSPASACRAVLFDAAGTLIETREPVGESYARASAAQGVEISAWRFEDAFRRVFADAPPMAFPEIEPEARPARERDWWYALARSVLRAADGAALLRDPDAWFDALWNHFAAPSAWRVRTGALEALTSLSARGLRLGVVSNFDTRLYGILAGLGLAGLFDCVLLPVESGACKPAPAPFALALERLGVAAPQAVYVGDDPERDLRAARAAGLHAIDVGGLATLADLPQQIDATATESRR